MMIALKSELPTIQAERFRRLSCTPILLLGHLYLAELAAAESSLVHVFVLSEESQDFGFRSFTSGQGGDTASNQPDCTSHRSLSVSAATFPSYFLPADEDTTVLQATLDAKIFLHRLHLHFVSGADIWAPSPLARPQSSTIRC